MSKIGIVVTSPICKTKRIRESEFIHGEILLYVYFGAEEFNSHTITQHQLFERMRIESDMPTTAQPSPQQISDVISEAKAKCDKLLIILPHQSLSGTYQNCFGVVQEREDKEDIFCLATNSIAISETAVVHKALDLIENGKQFASICSELTEFNKRLLTYAYPGSTRHLRKSGRISNSQALILGALSIRVQIKCAGDAPFSGSKGRGEKFVLKDIERELSKVSIEHIYYVSLAESKKLRDAIIAFFKAKEYPFTITEEADAVPCVHFGENTLGMTVVCR